MTQHKQTRRQLLGSALGLAGVVAAARTVVTAGAEPAGAAHQGVADAADVGTEAVRLSATTTSTTTTTTVPPASVPSRGQLRFPVDPAVTSFVLDNYGDCRGTRPHVGVDIMAPRGTAVYAVQRGVLVDWFTNTGTAGWGWTLLGDDGYRYRYMHLDALDASLAAAFAGVATGGPAPRVALGQVIGVVGSTGNDTADNVHLHFEVRPTSTTWTDPLPLLALPPTATVGPPLKGCL